MRQVQDDFTASDAELPEGWAILALAECVDVLDSMRVPVNSDERQSRQGTIPYYGATGQVGWIDDFIFDEELVLLGEDGAPFLDKSKPIAYIICGKSWVNNHAHVLRAKCAIIPNLYIKYALDAFDFTDQVNGTTRLKLTQGSMRAIPLRLAPLPEQKRIVAKVEALLARVNAARERLAKVPALLKRFRQSVLAAACSGQLTADWRDETIAPWTECSLGDLIKDGPQNGLYKPRDAYGHGTLIVRIANFYDGVIEPWDQLARLRTTKDELEAYGLRDADILVNRVNSMAFLGKSALVAGLNEPCVFESNMMRFRVDTRCILPQYLIRYLNSLAGLAELRRNAKHAVNQSSINQQDVAAVNVPFPPVEEQREIVHRVEALFALADKTEARLQAATARVEKITQAILAKTFRGELVPTEAELARQEGRDYEPASVLLERIRAGRAANANDRGGPVHHRLRRRHNG